MAVLFKPKKDREEHNISLISDAPGSWGCGAIKSVPVKVGGAGQPNKQHHCEGAIQFQWCGRKSGLA